MTEQLTSPERLEQAPELLPEHTTTKPEEDKKTLTPENDIEAIRQSIATEAVPQTDEIATIEQQESQPPMSAAISRQLKTQSLYRSLKNVRQHLPLTQRTLSRVIHQPVVETLSDMSSKTVARPSGILGGGIFAFLGSLAFLYYSKHAGFSYNYLLFGLFFAGGFILGIILETVVWLVFRKRRQS